MPLDYFFEFFPLHFFRVMARQSTQYMKELKLDYQAPTADEYVNLCGIFLLASTRPGTPFSLFWSEDPLYRFETIQGTMSNFKYNSNKI
jgi:hypothetical protein